MREGGDPPPQLIDVEGVCRERSGEQLALCLLDAVLNLAAGSSRKDL
jgi:hypothetical protein